MLNSMLISFHFLTLLENQENKIELLSEIGMVSGL